MKLVASSVAKTTTWIPFLLLSNILCMKSVKFYAHDLSPKSKFAIFFPAKLGKICEIKLPGENFCHTVNNCERVCFSCNLSALVFRFQQSRIRKLRKFFGQESHRHPPPPPPPPLPPPRPPLYPPNTLGRP